MTEGKSYIEEFYVTSHDVNPNNDIKPTQLIQYMQETADHQMRDRKPSYYELLDEGIGMVVVRMAVDIIRPIRMYDKICVRTWKCPDDGLLLYRSFDIRNEEGDLLAKAHSHWALVDANEGKLMKSRDVDFSQYEEDEPVHTDTPIKLKKIKGLNWKFAGSHKVTFDQIDINGHMNNTYYYNMLYSLIPSAGDYRIRGMGIRFMTEGVLDKDINVYIAEESKPEDRTVYYFYTEVDGRKNVEAMMEVERI